MTKLSEIFINESDTKVVLILQESIDKAISVLSENREYEKLIKFIEWVKNQTADDLDQNRVEDEPVDDVLVDSALNDVEDGSLKDCDHRQAVSDLRDILIRVCDIYHDEWISLDKITAISQIHPAVLKYCDANSIKLRPGNRWQDDLSKAISECPYLHKVSRYYYRYSRIVVLNQHPESSNGHQALLPIDC